MVYEQQLERRDVVLKSMWKMWNGRLRDYLAEYGLTEEQGVLAFQDQPFPRTEKQIFELIARCPAVMPVAERLLAHYIWTEGDTRKEFYKNEAVLRKSA
jgi:hypothetical protein